MPTDLDVFDSLTNPFIAVESHAWQMKAYVNLKLNLRLLTNIPAYESKLFPPAVELAQTFFKRMVLPLLMQLLVFSKRKTKKKQRKVAEKWKKKSEEVLKPIPVVLQRID